MLSSETFNEKKDKIKAFHLHETMQSPMTTTVLLEGAEVNKIKRPNKGGVKEILSRIGARFQ